ncbi:MAG: tetratricopeptide repeat protein [Acidobacteria bacterium]|nr:tetratricopeptide repeat protein [Acidobacteriota bacterium]
MPVPVMDGLEAEVRDYLLAEQRVLTDGQYTEAQLSEAYGKLGQIYHAHNFLTAAAACYANARQLAPQDFRWIYLLGNLALQERRNEEALAAFRLVQNLQPAYLAAWVNAGNLYLQQNRVAEAEAAFTAAVARDYACAAAHYGLGQVALTQRAYQTAVSCFERALAAAPEANRIHYALAMAQRGLGNREKAAAHLKLQGAVGVRAADPLLEALPHLARGERWHILRARRAFDAKRFAEAAAEYRLALAANPTSVTALVNLGTTLIQLGETATALERFTEALRHAPDNSAAHANLGFLLVKAQRHSDALPHFRAVLVQSPKDAEVRYQLALCLFKLNQNDEAARELEQVVTDDSAHEEALLQWVELAYQQKRYEALVTRLKQAHEQFPQRGRTAAALAFLLATVPDLKLRDGARALALAQLVYQSSDTVQHGAIVAFALAESGRCAEAANLQRRVIATAERAQQTELVKKLKGDLLVFERTDNCRPSF